MSYYGGTITVKGRDLITSLIAGETIEFTRIVVGSGEMPEGVEPIDMEALVNEVAEATSTVPTVENGVLSMVVEYRNDMNGGLETGFWLREFGIFAKTEDSEEILLYYATLGDSPQPVNAYKDNRVDIRRYPVTVALEVDADIQVTYNPGAFITAAEAEQLLESMVSKATYGIGIVKKIEFTTEIDEWKESEEQSNGYGFYFDLMDEEITSDMIPGVVISEDSQIAARNAGMSTTATTYTGYVRLKCMLKPDVKIKGNCCLMGTKTGGTPWIWPVASADTLGCVKIQPDSGLKVDQNGNLAVDTATMDESGDAINNIFGGE